jgi:hypothetical protein
MNRFLGAFLLAGTVAVAAGACDDSSSGDYYGNGGGDDCSANTTCDTCTPVQGCGWCFNAGGGVCASSPDECAAATSEFTWTWSQSGCPDVDASISGPDAGTPTSEASTSQADTGSPVSEASVADAGGGG